MSRLQQLFNKKNKKILNMYCTAGYPRLESTIPVMKAFQDNGADIIELGMPYSDPLADGEVIQHSSAVALANGMTIKKLFEQLQNFRNEISVPVVVMGYLNPLLQYGFENFCADCAKAGIDGLIIPDIPVHEYEKNYGQVVKKYGLDFIFLVTPETSEERVRKLDELSSGFLYAVSSSTTTGQDKDFKKVEAYLQRLQGYDLKNPILAGFGIKDKDNFNSVCKYANGAIIASAYINILRNAKSEAEATKQFVQSIIN